MNETTKPSGAPVPHERYMSSIEYVEQAPLNGMAVAAKATYLAHPLKSSLLFFIQAMSFLPGGLRKFAEEFLSAFQDRLGSPSMKKFGVKPGQVYTRAQVERVRHELIVIDGSFSLIGETQDECELPWANRQPRNSYQATEFLDFCRRRAASELPGTLESIALDPKVKIKLPTDSGEENWNASIHGFDNLIGALYEYQDIYKSKVQEKFALTTCAREVFRTLDNGLRFGKIVMIEGREGIGKSEAAETWCKMHSGHARYIQLRGITNRESFFRAIARALGLASGATRKCGEMQIRIEDTLQRCRLMLVFDEAHYLLPQTKRPEGQPELLNWVYTASSSLKFPVGLVTTSLFCQRMNHLKKQVIWNSGQFERRIHTFTKLEDETTKEDLMLVAAKLLPGVSQSAIKFVAGFAGCTRQHMTNLVDAVNEARQLASEDGREKVTFEDLEKAVHQFRVPSEKAKAEAFKPAAPAGRRRREMPEASAAPLHRAGNGNAEPEQRPLEKNRVNPSEAII